MIEFSSFTDAIAPQVYWEFFSTGGNIRRYREAGEDPGEAGVTPRFALTSAYRNLTRFGLPIHPIGDGTVDDSDAWTEFMNTAFENDAEAVSAFRVGLIKPALYILPAQPCRHVSFSFPTPGCSLARTIHIMCEGGAGILPAPPVAKNPRPS